MYCLARMRTPHLLSVKDKTMEFQNEFQVHFALAVISTIRVMTAIDFTSTTLFKGSFFKLQAGSSINDVTLNLEYVRCCKPFGPLKVKKNIHGPLKYLQTLKFP